MNMRPCRSQLHHSGFTLIEIVIGAALMSLILVSAYLCLDAGVSSQKMIEPRADIIQNARVAMALLTADLRDACPLSKDYEFLGMHRMMGQVEADNLDFATHNYTPSHAGEGDFCEVSYYLDQDPEAGQLALWRRRNPTISLDPLSGGSREKIAQGIVGMRLEYFDGYDWYDSWGDASGTGKKQTSNREQYNLSGLPEAVRITLLFDSNPTLNTNQPPGERTIEPPFVFQTVTRLELAERANRNASSESGEGSGGSESGSPGPGETQNGRSL